ncbi:MAG TPA: ribosome recycling factor [Thermodesulfobacteriota bacterium]|nr:ribosome recycling factor [Thermodesulfobacteriota bacterium]
MIEKVYQETRDKMEKALEALKKDFSRVRTGRATPTILDGIRVVYYGSPVPLNQVASVAVPDSRQITIQPWDLKAIGDIEKAILKSELGLTPINDGKIIRINIPSLTEERRRDLVKVTKKMAEEARVVSRNIRREANEALKSLKKDKAISEDDLFKAQDEVQKITKETIERVDKIGEEKEKEIMQF